ncbi:hypothetical protein K438DRAFT_359994 [Mycena galopus ATCC 62051]|nr:hypothetical protein K438DRAFT_359994 [Mycena galopus ATCC 62051]
MTVRSHVGVAAPRLRSPRLNASAKTCSRARAARAPQSRGIASILLASAGGGGAGGAQVHPLQSRSALLRRRPKPEPEHPRATMLVVVHGIHRPRVQLNLVLPSPQRRAFTSVTPRSIIENAAPPLLTPAAHLFILAPSFPVVIVRCGTTSNLRQCYIHRDRSSPPQRTEFVVRRCVKCEYVAHICSVYRTFAWSSANQVRDKFQ